MDLKPLFFDYDSRRVSRQHPCARCGRRIRPGEGRAWVRIKLIDDAPYVISPRDHFAAPTEDVLPLGMDCARKFGRVYWLKNDVQEPD